MSNLLLFNLNDFILLLTIILPLLCVLFAFSLNKFNLTSDIYLTVFLVAFTTFSIDLLFRYGEYINAYIINNYPNLTFSFTNGYWLVGPSLYLYICSILNKNCRFQFFDLLHTIPFILAEIYLYFSFYSLGYEKKMGLISSYMPREDGTYVFSLLLLFLHIFSYTVYSVYLIYKNERTNINDYNEKNSYQISWLKILALGFLYLEAFRFIAVIVFVSYDSLIVHNIVGVLVNYANLIFCIVILAYYLKYIFNAIRHNSLDGKNSVASHEKRSLSGYGIDKLNRAMLDQQLFVDPDLTLQKLSKSVGLSPKIVSTILNRHLHKNFYEFLNEYRITEAKKLLSDRDTKNVAITDIYLKVGFNSRSSFNTLFRKRFGMTPSQFRRKHEDLQRLKA